MRHETIRAATRFAHSRLKTDYDQFLRTSGSISLQDLFDPFPGFLKDFCSDFQPHTEIDRITQMAEKWGTNYGIWLPTAKYYVHCAIFLYPAASVQRLYSMVQNLAIGYYLNDVAGRDVFKDLSQSQQNLFKGVIQRMSQSSVSLAEVLHPVELANIDMLTSIRHSSTKDWFNQFINSFSYYIAVTHKDNNASAIGAIPTIEDYIKVRFHTSGMEHIVQFVEFSMDNFLDWNWLNSTGISGILTPLHRTASLIGALMNDLFSFEKEVIENESDSNLVMVIALNCKSASLIQCINEAASTVRELLASYAALRIELLKTTENIPLLQAEKLRKHLEGLDNVVKASWIWQVFTQRYKTSNSIWKETHIPGLAKAI